MENEIKYSEEIEKVVNQANENCALYGTDACRMLNAENCSECAVGKLKPEKQQAALGSLTRLYETVPPERIAGLYTSEKCLFCKGEHRGDRDCWGLFDMAKRDPEGDWTVAVIKNRRIGMKVADMLLPLQVSCCKDCRKRHRLFAYLPTLVALIVIAAGLILTTCTGLYKTLYDIAPWMPALTMVIFILLGVALHYIIRSAMAKAFSKKTVMDVSELPGISELEQDGFYEVAEKKSGVSNVVFSNKFREHGVGSLIPEKEDGGEPCCGGDEEPHLMGIWPAETPEPDPKDEPFIMGKFPAEAPEEAENDKNE